MPEDFRKFEREIKAEGYSLLRTIKGHYWVVSPHGGKLITFAVKHGGNTRTGEVKDCYVRKVRKRIEADKRKIHP